MSWAESMQTSEVWENPHYDVFGTHDGNPQEDIFGNDYLLNLSGRRSKFCNMCGRLTTYGGQRGRMWLCGMSFRFIPLAKYKALIAKVHPGTSIPTSKLWCLWGMLEIKELLLEYLAGSQECRLREGSSCVVAQLL